MPASRKTPASSPATLDPAIGSATSTVSGPAHGPDDAAVAALKQPSVQALAAKQAETQALVAAMPANPLKPLDHGLANGHAPAQGPSAKPASPSVGASTLSESNESSKLGTGTPVVGFNASQGPLDTARVDSGGQALTTNQGVLVADNQNSLKAGLRGPTLLEDFVLREKISHFDHERIPERVVHARGSAAHGYFECDIALGAITRAAPFAEVGKRTPVFVRFSTVAGERGSTDTARDVRGFAVKLYTDEGNWDLVGNNIPVFFIQDAMKFPDLIHAAKPEPHHAMPQAGTAHDTFWDFASLSPETAHMLMWAMSDRAIPRSYRTMQGFGVHTFRLVNSAGESRFCKFHWTPAAGTHSLVWDEAVKLSGCDSDFHRRDLWEAIEAGHYPEWTLGLQVFTQEQADAFSFDVLDPTKLVPEELVPVRPVGRMVLDRNPDNFFAETEQVAFCTAHVVPGIDFTNDPLLQGRIHSYFDTQITRLGGANFHEIPINAPVVEVHNNQRDGIHRRAIPRGRVAYEPNSLGGGCPFQAGSRGFVSFPEPLVEDKVRGKPEKFADHYSQATLFWNSQTPTEQNHIVAAYRFELTRVQTPAIRARVVSLLRNVDERLAQRVADGLGMDLPPAQQRALEPPVRSEIHASPALSLFAHPGDGGVAARRVAILVIDGVQAGALKAVYDALAHARAAPRFVGVKLGRVKADGGQAIEVEATLETMPSPMWDAVVIPGGALADARLADVGAAVEFVKEQYRHCKTLLVLGAPSSSKLLDAAGISLAEADVASDPGLIQVDASVGGGAAVDADDGELADTLDALPSEADVRRATQAFLIALGRHKHYERERDPAPV
jgi:catalase